MAILAPLAVLVVLCTLLWRRSDDRRPLLRDIEVDYSLLTLVLDRPVIFASRFGSDVSSRFGFTVIDTARMKIYQCRVTGSRTSPQLIKDLFKGLGIGQAVRSIAGTRYVFAVSVPDHGVVLVHRFESGLGINCGDGMLKSVLRSFWAIGKQLSFETSNGLVSNGEETEERNEKLESEDQNALSSFQSKTSPTYEVSKQYRFTVIVTPRVKIYKCRLDESPIPTPEVMKALFQGLGIGQAVRSMANSSQYAFAVTVPDHGVVLVHRYGFGPGINKQDEMLKSILRSFRAIGRQLTLSSSTGVKAIQDRLSMLKESEEENEKLKCIELSSLQTEDAYEQMKSGNSSDGEEIDMELDDLNEEEEELSVLQAVSEEVSNITSSEKKICEKKKEKAENDQMKKMKVMEKEKERKRREKLIIKEGKIEEARKRRNLHFNEKMNKARSMRYLTDQKLNSSKTKAFGFSKGFRAKFQLIEKMGSGTYGTVFKARFKHRVISPKSQFVAVKLIEKSKFKSPIDIEGVKIEVKIMETLKGQNNMLEFHGAYEDSKNVYLVMELCEGGDITDVFNRYGGTFMENETRLLIKQILKALSVCHRNNILHRDLKMENFIFAVKGDVRSIRLIDFGLSEFIMPGEYLDYPAGSPDYISPEVFDGFAGYESDCWSVGVIAYFLLVKKFPFEQGPHFSESDIDTWRPDISQGPDFSDRTWLLVPREARDLVKGLLQPDPKLRLTVQDALRHEYFKGRRGLV